MAESPTDVADILHSGCGHLHHCFVVLGWEPREPARPRARLMGGDAPPPDKVVAELICTSIGGAVSNIFDGGRGAGRVQLAFVVRTEDLRPGNLSSTEHIERGLRAYGAVQQQAAVNFHGLPAKLSRGLAGSRGLESGVNQ